MSHYASVPAVNQYLRAAEAIGVDAEPLLQHVNIDAAQLEDNTRLIPADRLEQQAHFFPSLRTAMPTGSPSGYFTSTATVLLLFSQYQYQQKQIDKL